MPLNTPKGPRYCKKRTVRNVERWLRTVKKCHHHKPLQGCRHIVGHFNCTFDCHSVVDNSRQGSFTAQNNGNVNENSVDEIVILDSESENLDSESENLESESDNLQSESDNLDSEIETLDSESSNFEIDSDNFDLDNIDINSDNYDVDSSNLGIDHIDIDSLNYDFDSQDFDDGNDGSESGYSISTFTYSLPTFQYILDSDDDLANDLREMDEVQISDDTINHVPIDITKIKNIPKKNRLREWMQTPTPGINLTQGDIHIQESELVRHYKNALPIEASEDVVDEAANGNVCTICTVKRATRVISPCGHYVCSNCMTHMVTNRESYRGVTKAKCCGVCMMAVGMFLRVY